MNSGRRAESRKSHLSSLHAFEHPLDSPLRPEAASRTVCDQPISSGSTSRTSIALTGQGRAALDAYTSGLRDLLGGL
jgi:hypothetical protein